MNRISKKVAVVALPVGAAATTSVGVAGTVFGASVATGGLVVMLVGAFAAYGAVRLFSDIADGATYMKEKAEEASQTVGDAKAAWELVREARTGK